jgi:VanZ family protein
MLALAIVVLSVVPASDRPTTGIPHNMEHLAIYLATGFVIAIGYRDRLPVVTAGLVLFCGLIEFMQLWVPGRHARLSDFLVDVVGTWIGVAALVAAKWILPRRLEL